MSAFVTAFTATPEMEGPQILLLWTLPTNADTSQIKVLRKEKSHPEDETDGDLLVDELVSADVVSYVDLNPTIDTAWCYAAFAYHTCTTSWAADSLFQAGATVIPTTPNGFFYVSDTRGLTSSPEPTWPTVIGATVEDGDITWTCLSANPGWISDNRSRDSAFTWDSEYMQRLLFRKIPAAYRNADAKSTLVSLSAQQDADNYDVWRAIHEDGTTERGDFERFLLIFGTALSRIRGAADFLPRLVDPDEALPKYLPLLAGILGWELITTFPTGKQRQDIMSAVPTYKIKGTVNSLEPSLRQAAGVEDVVVDPMSRHIMMSNRTTRLSAHGQLAGTYQTWAATTAYSRGDIVIPTSSNRTGYYYQTREAGTSAGSEPTWPTTPGDDVSDNALIWRCVQFGVPHLTANVSAGGSSLSVDDTTPFETGKTINVRDYRNHAVDSFTASSTITLEAGEGDVSAQYPAGRRFVISGSSGGLNNGIYTVESAPSAVPTVITTVEDTLTTEGSPSPAISNPEGEEIIVSDIPSSTTLTLDGTLTNGYTLQNNALVCPAYDWYDDETGFIWDIPVIDDFDGIDPTRVRVPGAIIEASELYSFEILRLWFLLQGTEAVSNVELEAVAKTMLQFAPADTSYVVRIEGP